MTNARKLKLAFKYRRLLWKYRGLYRHRRMIAGLAIAGAASAVVLVGLIGPARLQEQGR
jgi:hypothetical protein